MNSDFPSLSGGNKYDPKISKSSEEKPVVQRGEKGSVSNKDLVSNTQKAAVSLTGADRDFKENTLVRNVRRPSATSPGDKESQSSIKKMVTSAVNRGADAIKASGEAIKRGASSLVDKYDDIHAEKNAKSVIKQSTVMRNKLQKDLDSLKPQLKEAQRKLEFNNKKLEFNNKLLADHVPYEEKVKNEFPKDRKEFEIAANLNSQLIIELSTEIDKKEEELRQVENIIKDKTEFLESKKDDSLENRARAAIKAGGDAIKNAASSIKEMYDDVSIARMKERRDAKKAIEQQTEWKSVLENDLVVFSEEMKEAAIEVKNLKDELKILNAQKELGVRIDDLEIKNLKDDIKDRAEVITRRKELIDSTKNEIEGVNKNIKNYMDVLGWKEGEPVEKRGLFGSSVFFPPNVSEVAQEEVKNPEKQVTFHANEVKIERDQVKEDIHKLNEKKEKNENELRECKDVLLSFNNRKVSPSERGQLREALALREKLTKEQNEIQQLHAKLDQDLQTLNKQIVKMTGEAETTSSPKPKTVKPSTSPGPRPLFKQGFQLPE